MSERKSWDIQPRRRPIAHAPSAHQSNLHNSAQHGTHRSTQSVSIEHGGSRLKKRRSFFAPKAPKIPKPPKLKKQPKKRSTRPQYQEVIEVSTKPAISRRNAALRGSDRESLKERRRREKIRARWTLVISLVLLIIGCIGIFWLPYVRIQHIDAAGPDASGMQSIASASLAGTYYYLFPRNSIFLFPEDAIIKKILSQYPDISEVSISRSSFDSVGIISIPREAVLTWCGSTYTPGVSATASVMGAQMVAEASSTDVVHSAGGSDATDTAAVANATSDNSINAETPTCYSADTNGILFAPITEAVTPSTENLILYGPLQNPLSGTASSSPIGSVIAEANMIPNALQFVKAMRSLGAPVVTLVLRGDEADLYTLEGTRITYVLGEEHDAAQLAESAFPSLDVSDGSLEYIDLRFQGKVYFKKAGDTSESSSTPQSQ